MVLVDNAELWTELDIGVEIMYDGAYLSSSWLNGQYYDICGFNVTIDSSISFASFEFVSDSDEVYDFQGSEADEVIENIAEIWNNAELAQDDAIASWIKAHI